MQNAASTDNPGAYSGSADRFYKFQVIGQVIAAGILHQKG